MLEIEILEFPWGFGYRVDSVYQEYNPDKAGFVPMTREEAEEFAQAVKTRLEG